MPEPKRLSLGGRWAQRCLPNIASGSNFCYIKRSARPIGEPASSPDLVPLESQVLDKRGEGGCALGQTVTAKHRYRILIANVFSGIVSWGRETPRKPQVMNTSWVVERLKVIGQLRAGFGSKLFAWMSPMSWTTIGRASPSSQPTTVLRVSGNVSDQREFG